MTNTRIDIKNIDNTILKTTFLIANYYFMIKNYNFGFYVQIIEKTKELSEKEEKDKLLILEKALDILEINNIVKNDLKFLYEESLKYQEILDNIIYDVESFCYDLMNKKENKENKEKNEKYNNLLNELKKYSENIKAIISNIEKIKNFNFKNFCNEKNTKKFLIELYDLKKKLDDFII